MKPDYTDFLSSKIKLAPKQGFEILPSQISKLAKPHQVDTIIWSAEGGRRLIAKSFGLGKTFDQIELSRITCEKYDGRFLITCPLNVSYQFIEEDGPMLGVKMDYVRSTKEFIDSPNPICLTNYERVRDGGFDIDKLQRFHGLKGISLDEGSVLRSFGSETSLQFNRIFKNIEYKYVFTATPSPNNYIEILGYAEFLGIMDKGQAKTRFFDKNSSKADQLVLNPMHEKDFWMWVSSWALFLTRPSDLGYSDEGYALPELVQHWVEVPTDPRKYGVMKNRDGQVKLLADAANGLPDLSKIKQATISERLEAARKIMAEHDPKEHWILWHLLEPERAAIEKHLPEFKTVFGKQKLDHREEILLGFTKGNISKLSTKPEIAGLGCNFQKFCHLAIFMSLNHKFEEFIQAVHRLYRFMQGFPVHIWLLYVREEQAVVDSLKLKWKQHNEMMERMSEIIRTYGLHHSRQADLVKRSFGVKRVEVKGANYTAVNNDTVHETKLIESNSKGMILTSIPFSIQYEYSASYHDFGHNESNEKFFEQMHYTLPDWYRVLQPGRMCIVHVKDRIVPGNFSGLGFATIYEFSDDTIKAFKKNGFGYCGRITVVTDVVRENNQTYRLGWTENCKDGTKMGVGLPEYILIFRKPPTDISNAYADEPVIKFKEDYSRARWQVDAHGFWKSSGNRLLRPEEIAALELKTAIKYFNNYSFNEVYNYEKHVAIGEALEKRKKLPSSFMAIAPQSAHPDVWTDITRVRTLNTMQGMKGEKQHLCPLQFDLVERCINRYTNADDEILDPFGGIFTTAYIANKMGRRAYIIELSKEYFNCGVQYMKEMEHKKTLPSLFDVIKEEEPEMLESY